MTHTLTLVLNLLGNIARLGIYMAPMPVIWRIHRQRAVGGYDIFPYISALFSSVMWVYYSALKGHALFPIISNSVGCALQILYIFVHTYYAQRIVRMRTGRFVLVGAIMYLLTVPLTYFLMPEIKRLILVGWMCVASSLVVSASPLLIVVRVIRTNNADAMPVLLSVALTLNGITLTLYGLIVSDYDIVFPNLIGAILGIAQIIIYMVYRRRGGAAPVDGPELQASQVELDVET